jgi:hypothetical protein
MGKKVLKTKILFGVLMWPSKINKILEHKFQLLLYSTSNTKFQNVFFHHVVNICSLHKKEKKMGQKCKKKTTIYRNRVPENI